MRGERKKRRRGARERGERERREKDNGLRALGEVACVSRVLHGESVPKFFDVHLAVSLSLSNSVWCWRDRGKLASRECCAESLAEGGGGERERGAREREARERKQVTSPWHSTPPPIQWAI